MFHKFIQSISGINQRGRSSQFNAYLMGIQRSGRPGAATINEARKDYASAHRSNSRLILP